MVVRFLPTDRSPRRETDAADRGDLAEIISFRTRMVQHESADGEEGDDAGEGDSETASRGRPALVALQAAIDGRLARTEPLEPETPPDTPTDSRSRVADEAEASPGPERSAYDEGVRLLARRARSSGELRGELLAREHDAAEVEAVIAEFERARYLDDAGLARAVTEKLRETKRASRMQIRIKLRERRLDDTVIEHALGELDDDEEFELLRSAAADRAKRLGGLDRQTAERRLLGFLARRGWSGEPAMRAARSALDGASRGPRGGVRFHEF